MVTSLQLWNLAQTDKSNELSYQEYSTHCFVRLWKTKLDLQRIGDGSRWIELEELVGRDGFGVAQAIGEVGQRWNLPLSCTKGVGHFRHGRSVGGSRIQLQLQASHWGRRVQSGGRIAGSFQVWRDLQSAYGSAQHTLLSIRYPCSASTQHVELLIRQGLVSLTSHMLLSYVARVSITSYESQNVQSFVSLSSSFEAHELRRPITCVCNIYTATVKCSSNSHK